MTTTQNLSMSRTPDGTVLLELDGAAVGLVDPATLVVALVDVLELHDVADAARMMAASQ